VRMGRSCAHPGCPSQPLRMVTAWSHTTFCGGHDLMQVRIHRGAHEIGGSCIEVVAGPDRLVLDVGRPLSAAWDHEVPLPDIPGLSEPDPNLHGVLLSHAHLDHYGLAASLHPDVPVFLGEDATRVLEAAAFFSPISRPPRVTGHLADGQVLHLGPFTVTPYLADHSAFDAYSLLIETEGRRLFYTGDIRSHGRKGALFERLCRTAPDVDVLLMEGTHVRADGDTSTGPSESDVETELLQTFEETSGLVAVFSSAQNIDRLVTCFRAARRASRMLVVDLYTATVAAATGRDSIPQPGFDGFAVYVPERQRRRVAESGHFSRVNEIAGVRLYLENLAEGRGDLAYLGTSSTALELVEAGALRDGKVVWSLWDGYLEVASGRRLVELLEESEIPLVHHHASGHAYVPDLKRLVDAFAPARVVPIHSEAADRFADHFPRVEQHADGEWWVV
jgi:ribonuclease J